MMLELVKETLKNLFKRPATYKFPLEDRPASSDYRGKQVVDIKKCIGCRLCAIDCPAYAIEMTPNPSGKPKEYPVVDFGKCVFCYQCVRVCPVDAYVTSNTYRLASFNKESLISDVLKTSASETAKGGR
jgi:NADH-quinone oxidoreductase subunit I